MNQHTIDNNQDLSLLSDEFLATLLEQKERTIYARITSLDIEERPLDTIEGKVTGGSINIDGASSVRRTCNLTMISDEVDINDFYWGIKTKFKLEIGIKNNLFQDGKVLNQYYYFKDGLYPDIVWFPEGIFLITSFNTSITTNSCTISLQGKDKMSLLNGDLGGQLFASIDFGQEEFKNAIMKEASIDANNSDIIMSHEYYIKRDHLDGQLPDKVLESNTACFFIQDPVGVYYKKANVYFKGIFNINSNTNEITSFQTNKGENFLGTRYTLYQKVLSPDDLFQLETNLSDPIEKNKYYYSVQPHYYSLNKTAHPKGDGNYSLRVLYTIDYEYSIKKMPLEKIIRESVHEYAKEPYHNIIINDLDDYGLEQLTYRGDQPVVVFRNLSSNFTQMILANNFEVLNHSIPYEFKKDTETNLFKLQPKEYGTGGTIINFIPDSLTPEIANSEGTKFWVHQSDHRWHLDHTSGSTTEEPYTAVILEYGDDIGYRLTDLTYTGDLISSIGDSLVSILDKIKAMLGDFEYFYDVYGHFIFQRKKTYVNTSWSQLTKTEDESYVDYINGDHRKFSFNFEGNRLLTAVSNAPVLNNLRNDFVVWGKRTTVSGAEVPIHARYAIDKKPNFYKTLTGKIYVTENWLNENPDSPLLHEYSAEESNGYGLNWQKEPVPKALWKDEYGNSDWYEVSNWGRWYEMQIGAPPSMRMMEYQTGEEGFKGVLRFSRDDNPNHDIVLNCNRGKGQLMLDLDEQTGLPYVGAKRPTEDENGNLIASKISYGSFDQHRWGGCGHTFLLVLQTNAVNPRMKSYIYKPQLPSPQVQQEDLEHADENPLTTEELKEKRIYVVDWREIIYQMALDQHAGQGCSPEDPIYDIDDKEVMNDPDHLLPIIAQNNPDYYPTGYTGYEQYYTDMLGFWRQLYNPDYIPKEIWSIGEYKNIAVTEADSMYFTTQKVWQESYIKGYNIEFYFSFSNSDIQEQYQNLISLYNGANTEQDRELFGSQLYKYRKYCVLNSDLPSVGIEESQGFEHDQGKMFWNIDVFENPEKLNFWIDFLDSASELAEFSIPIVGDRTKVINEDKATSIIFKEIPDVVLYDTYNTDRNGPDMNKLKKQIEDVSGYTFIYLPKGFSELLTISYRNLSVKNKIDELLYQYAYCIENVTITALPIYHLQPNTRIYVQDKTTNINGEYIVNKITLPLTYNGTMSVNANKAPERFY